MAAAYRRVSREEEEECLVYQADLSSENDGTDDRVVAVAVVDLIFVAAVLCVDTFVVIVVQTAVDSVCHSKKYEAIVRRAVALQTCSPDLQLPCSFPETLAANDW